MGDLLSILHPPGWTIWQTIGTGAMLTIGYAVGKLIMDVVGNVISRARK